VRTTTHHRHVLLLAVLLAAGCSGAGESTTDGPPQPIAGLTAGTWTWVDFPDSACQDGTPTGIGLSPGTSADLVLYLQGGGACWDSLTCVTFHTASRGPFGRAEFEALRSGTLPGSILDRTLAGNPFAAATLVFVPYCTGDVHAGDRVTTYGSGSGAVTWRHVGRANLAAYLRRLAVTFTEPPRVAVTGSSAGGFGALANYDAVRAAWPAAAALLLDDSGPPLLAADTTPALAAAWREAWGLDPLLDPLCGEPCRAGFAPLLGALAARHPQDRLALLSSEQDGVISAFYGLDGAAFQAAQERMLAAALAPLAHARSFVVAGSSHTMLGRPAAFTQGEPLLGWIGQAWSGDGGWSAQHP
jgi:hypothetical protein